MGTKIFFLFAMLVSVAASAQSTVQITPISATYTTTPTIQFKVSWTNQLTDNHRNKVWIFVDFQPVISPIQKENWQSATITGTVQKTAGTVSEQSNRGFFIEGTTTDFSSTVTVQLSNTGAQFNWCAYASDCPPNIGDYNNGTYTLRGTPPFMLKDANGVTQPVPDKTIAQSALTITPITMTDATGCPGYFCKYIGRDLYIDATHKCGLRTSGAQNWEAWIKDTRDNELYRIVYMPDNKWWLAQNVKLASYNGSTVGATATKTGCTKDKCGRWYSAAQTTGAWGGTSGTGTGKQGICPNGWILPTLDNYETFVNSIAATTITFISYGRGKYGINTVVTTRLQSLDCVCADGTNYYGWASEIGAYSNYNGQNVIEMFGVNRADNTLGGLTLNHVNGGEHPPDCQGRLTLLAQPEVHHIPVRCFRQL